MRKNRCNQSASGETLVSAGESRAAPLRSLVPILLGIAASVLGTSPAAAQATFRSLGTTGSAEILTDISANGSVVSFGSGETLTLNGSFAWRQAEQFAIPLQDCAGTQSDGSNVRGISGNGAVAVGACNSQTLGIAAVRTVSALIFAPGVDPPAMAPLGNLGNTRNSLATATSFDGSVIVGWSNSSSIILPGGLETQEAFHWVNPDPIGNPTGMGQMSGLGFLTLRGDVMSRAYDVSADGLVIVGRSSDGSTRAEAVRWVVDANGNVQSMTGLGDLQVGTGPTVSTAFAVSPNGESVVGEARTAPGSIQLEPFLWSLTSGQMLRLGGPSGEHIVGRALAVSADGSVVVGSMNQAAGSEAFIWTAGTGVRSLQSVAIAQGAVDAVAGAPVDLSQWSLISASGVTDDGTTISISGYGVNPLGVNQAWLIQLANVPEPGTALLFAAALVGLTASRGRSARRGRERSVDRGEI